MNLLADIQRAVTRHGLIHPGERVLVAVSGGCDSVGLLHVLHRLSVSMECPLAVAHLDHGLRGAESEEDARFVEAMAGSLGLPFLSRRADTQSVARAEGISIEMAARELRYAFFGEAAREWNAGVIATAHTADDLAETLLLFLVRGAGTGGLGGFPWMRPLAPGQPEIRVVRPFRSTSRGAVRAWLDQQDIRWRHDRTNDDPAPMRNRIRQELLPLLGDRFNPRAVEALARAADRWIEADSFIDARAGEALAAVLLSSGSGRIVLDAIRLAAYDGGLHGRVLRAACSLIMSRPLSEQHTDSLVALACGQRGEVTLPEGFRALRDGDRVIIEARQVQKPPGKGDTSFRRGESLAPGAVPTGQLDPASPLKIPGCTPLGPIADREGHLSGNPPGESFLQAWVEPATAGTASLPGNRIALDWDALVPPLAARHPRPGDRMRPLGFRHRRKLQDILVDRKVPREKRPGLWVVEDQERILWVVGIVRSEDARVTGGTARQLILEEQRA